MIETNGGRSLIYRRYVTLPSGKWEVTNREISRFANALSYYSALYDKIPGPTLSDAIAELDKDKSLSEKFGYYPLIRRHCDGWGQELIYECHMDGRSVTLRSVGANGIDEAGRGDDIQRIVTSTSPEE